MDDKEFMEQVERLEALLLEGELAAANLFICDNEGCRRFIAEHLLREGVLLPPP